MLLIRSYFSFNQNGTCGNCFEGICFVEYLDKDVISLAVMSLNGMDILEIEKF